HVLSLVGGFTTQYKSGNQKGEVYIPIDVRAQIDAIEFLMSNAFNVPNWLSNPSFMDRIQYSTNLDQDRLMKLQLSLLYETLNPNRLKRLQNMETNSLPSTVSKDILINLRLGLFKE